MSSLGLSLLILALLGVGGILIYNLWLGGNWRRTAAPKGSGGAAKSMRSEPRISAAGSSGPEVSDVPASLQTETAHEQAAQTPLADFQPEERSHRGSDSHPSPAGDPVLSVQDRLLEAQGARSSHPPARLDPIVDCCVFIALAAPVPAERLIAMTRAFRRAGSKPVLIEACVDELESWMAQLRPAAKSAAEFADEPDVLAIPQLTESLDAAQTATLGMPAQDSLASVAATTEDGAQPDSPDDAPSASQLSELDFLGVETTGEPSWQTMTPGRFYRGLKIGILMANRHGPLNAMEYSEFVSGLSQIGGVLGATVETPDMMDVLVRAKELDARCAALDAQIGVNVEAPEALSPADLQSIAQSAEIVERGNNRYARLDDNGDLVFSVALGETPNRLTFLLDVPRVRAESTPLRDMVACAWHCTQVLQGKMVDDTGRALSDAIFQRIESQLDERYAALSQAGFGAGSPTALRLFN